ncbi:D-2-hydroxyacid dehydrogenase [uncultured Limosilactobacillus sp.]|uniref:D-2-hydroxyacid dehydrogenase n=1 Tax=uncultured Limosilactobacillus sp. TaxID=2837629 RepID=UPI0025F8EB63|nr:D-2-hydroxyacid dehydrogenase [uncultured Limosilactobacillus sp.]
MKIIMYNVRQDTEERFVHEWEQETGNEVKIVHEPLSADNVNLMKGCDGLDILQTMPIGDEAVYKQIADMGIKQITCRMVGINMINLDACKKYNLKVTHVPVYSPRAIAEMGVTHAMYLLRRIGEYRYAMDHNADFSWPANLMSNEIFNLTVGLIGLGNIGSATAQIYKALGAKVIAFDPSYNPADEPFVNYVDSADEVIKNADILSLHVPLLPSTKGMIGAEQLKMMKNSAYLINMSRGGLVDTEALIQALKNHEIAGAGLDTLADETTYFGKKVTPADVPEDYKELAAMPNVTITPHAAFFTETAVRNMVRIGLNDVVTIVNGGRSRNEVFVG